MLASLNSFGNIDTNYTVANRQVQWAEFYSIQLAQLQYAWAEIQVNPVFPTVTAPPTPLRVSPPAFPEITWTDPGQPSPFTGTLNVDGLLPAPFDGQPPSLSFPTAPASFSETAPTAPGINTQFNYPADLTVNLPAAPELLTLNVAQFGGITMPTAPDSNLPELTAVEPTVVQYTPGALYTSALLTQLKTTLEQRIANGDGLPPAIEQAIWDRNREREYRAQADALADLDRMESLGYAFPPGPWLDARLKIQTETNYNISMASREQAIKAAEMRLDTIKHALSTAVDLEGRLVNYANETEQRSLEAAKYATQAGVEVYNAKVRAYTAYLDAYKTKVQIYTAQIQAEVAKVDAYKAQVQAEEAKAQVNTALVQQYKVQADVALSAIEIYKAQIAAIQSKAEIEKLKIEIYGEQIKAYTGKISAYTAQVEGYKAAVQAEGVKQESFKSQVQAYAARVDAGAKAIEARIAEFKGRLDAKSQEWEGYKAIVEGEKARVQSIAAANQTIAEAFKAEVSAVNSYNEVITKQWEASTNIAARVAEVAVNVAKMNAELYMTQRQMAMEAAKVGAQVAAQIGAAALNAVQWSSSASNGQSISENYNYSN